MLRRLALAAAVVAALIAAQVALAASPAAMLAATLKSQMQAFYDKEKPVRVIHSVSCTLAAGERSARCVARYSVAALELNGVFELAVRIDRTTGEAYPKTVSNTCTDAKTGKPTIC